MLILLSIVYYCISYAKSKVKAILKYRVIAPTMFVYL